MNPATPALSLRRAARGDAARLFEWANDPVTRAQSFSTNPIAWDEHCAWLEQTLTDPSRYLYIVELDGGSGAAEPVGQVRFDASGDGTAGVSLSLAPAWRGRGLAATALRLAITRVMSESGISIVRALVKPSNDASIRSFLRAGFDQAGHERHRSDDVVRFEFRHPTARSAE